MLLDGTGTKIQYSWSLQFGTECSLRLSNHHGRNCGYRLSNEDESWDHDYDMPLAELIEIAVQELKIHSQNTLTSNNSLHQMKFNRKRRQQKKSSRKYQQKMMNEENVSLEVTVTATVRSNNVPSTIKTCIEWGEENAVMPNTQTIQGRYTQY